jgi:hypothetical protein
MRKLFSTILVALALGVAACTPQPGAEAPAKKSQSQKAAEAANSIQFTENAEIDNIKKRLELTSQPGLLGFLAVINAAGAPVMYTCVKGKITSGGKRLTAPWKFTHGDKGEFSGDFVTPSPSDEGTWGSSNPYVYWWTCNDQYIQTTGDYIYSDKPFRLTNQPLIAIDAATKAAERGE